MLSETTKVRQFGQLVIACALTYRLSGVAGEEGKWGHALRVSVLGGALTLN